MTARQRFAHVLKAAREGSGMTQREFAAVLGLSQPRYCQLETGIGGDSYVRAAKMFLVLEEEFAVGLEDLV